MGPYFDDYFNHPHMYYHSTSSAAHPTLASFLTIRLALLVETDPVLIIDPTEPKLPLFKKDVIDSSDACGLFSILLVLYYFKA